MSVKELMDKLQQLANEALDKLSRSHCGVCGIVLELAEKPRLCEKCESECATKKDE